MRTVGLQGEPLAVSVEDEEAARKLGFRGSPTVTVDGRDADDSMVGEPSLAYG
jgi:hypothetical protein